MEFLICLRKKACIRTKGLGPLEGVNFAQTNDAKSKLISRTTAGISNR